MTLDLRGWKAIATQLGVTEKTARAWMRAAGRRGPVKVFRRRVAANAAALAAWLEAQHQPYAA